ncbi:MAG: tetratricopeptide repeat protein [Bacteroidota bacterium]
MHQLNRDDKELQILVHQYEEMLRKDAVAFFEQSAFERILDYYENQHRWNLALEVVDYALQQHPYSSIFFIRKAQLLLEKNKVDEALECLKQAEMFDASELEIFLLKSEALSWSGRYEEALAILEASKKQFPLEDHDEIYMAIANVYEDMELFEKSFKAVSKALKVKPSNKNALDRIWLLVELSGKYAESVRIHQELLDEDPYSYQAWYNLGHAHFCLNDYEKAVEAFEFAIVIDETFEFAYRDCGEALFKLGLYERAIRCYMDALEYIKPDADLYTNIGLCFEQLDQSVQAKNYYLKAIKFDPQSDHSFFRLGECYAREEYWVSAIGAYNKAIKLNALNADYVAALAEAYVQIGEEQKAAKMFRTATEMAPEESGKWVQFASFLLMSNKPELALEVIEEAFVYCDSPSLDYCQTATLLNMGYRKAAIQSLQNALAEDFDLHIILFSFDEGLRNDAEIMEIIEMYRS